MKHEIAHFMNGGNRDLGGGSAHGTAQRVKWVFSCWNIACLCHLLPRRRLPVIGSYFKRITAGDAAGSTTAGEEAACLEPLR